ATPRSSSVVLGTPPRGTPRMPPVHRSRRIRTPRRSRGGSRSVRTRLWRGPFRHMGPGGTSARSHAYEGRSVAGPGRDKKAPTAHRDEGTPARQLYAIDQDAAMIHDVIDGASGHHGKVR